MIGVHERTSASAVVPFQPPMAYIVRCLERYYTDKLRKPHKMSGIVR